MARKPEVSPERPSAAGSSSGNGGLRRSPTRPRRKPPLIFLSYCREDAYWVGLLLKVLKFLEIKHRVRIFQDTRNIEIGDAWHEEVKQAIREASIAICFLSTDYFASKFCMTHEVPMIRKRHRLNRLRVYPVLLKDCLWDADKFWSSLQLFTDNGKHLVNGNGTSRSERVQQMFVVLAREIMSALLPEPPSPPEATATGSRPTRKAGEKASGAKPSRGKKKDPNGLAFWRDGGWCTAPEFLQYLGVGHATNNADAEVAVPQQAEPAIPERRRFLGGLGAAAIVAQAFEGAIAFMGIDLPSTVPPKVHVYRIGTLAGGTGASIFPPSIYRGLFNLVPRPVSADSSVVMIGQRRLGKTSLLASYWYDHDLYLYARGNAIFLDPVERIYNSEPTERLGRGVFRVDVSGASMYPHVFQHYGLKPAYMAYDFGCGTLDVACATWPYYAARDWGVIALEAGERSGLFTAPWFSSGERALGDKVAQSRLLYRTDEEDKPELVVRSAREACLSDLGRKLYDSLFGAPWRDRLDALVIKKILDAELPEVERPMAEREADRFADDLLMPEERVRKEFHRFFGYQHQPESADHHQGDLNVCSPDTLNSRWTFDRPVLEVTADRPATEIIVNISGKEDLCAGRLERSLADNGRQIHIEYSERREKINRYNNGVFISYSSEDKLQYLREILHSGNPPGRLTARIVHPPVLHPSLRDSILFRDLELRTAPASPPIRDSFAYDSDGNANVNIQDGYNYGVLLHHEHHRESGGCYRNIFALDSPIKLDFRFALRDLIERGAAITGNATVDSGFKSAILGLTQEKESLPPGHQHAVGEGCNVQDKIRAPFFNFDGADGIAQIINPEALYRTQIELPTF